jgi:hypothetical protein
MIDAVDSVGAGVAPVLWASSPEDQQLAGLDLNAICVPETAFDPSQTHRRHYVL